MANSVRNVTVPLQSQLNMNRNQSLTTSSYDIFNSLNAPVFGGCISPLHYKYDSVGDAKYSRDGTKWSVKENTLYKDDLLFKNFTGEKSFEMKDTGLDLDGIVSNGNGYVGIKFNTSGITWSKLDSNFNKLATGDIVSNTAILTTARIVKRFNGIYLLALLKPTASRSYYLAIERWDDGFAQLFTTGSFSFKKADGIESWTKTDNDYLQTQTVENAFITVSKEFTENGTTVCGVSVFKERPKASNAFKNVEFATFEMYDGLSGGRFREICIRSGYDVAPLVSVDNGTGETRANKQTWGYFVDGTNVIQSVGHAPATRDSDWWQMQCIFDGVTENGSYDGLRKFYPTYSGRLEAAIEVTIGANAFAGISKMGSSCLTVNFNGYGRLVDAGYGNVPDAGSSGISAPCVNVLFDSQFTCPIYNAGVTSNASIPTTADGWNSWWDNRLFSQNTCWNPAGSRLRIGTTNFYILFNGKDGNVAGVSYSNSPDKIGTLLTEWGMPVQTFEIFAENDRVFFKDGKTNTVKYVVAKNGITLDDIEVNGNYILIRCSADENIYDAKQKKWAKFSNDWNNRIFFGYKNIKKVNNSLYTESRSYAVKAYQGSWQTSGAVAAGYDVAYQKEKGFSPSRLYAYTALSGVVLSTISALGCELTSENGLDVFASSGTSAPAYKCTLFGNGASSTVSNLAGSVYPITSSGSAYFNIPIIESTVVDSYNGKYGLKIDGSVYTIAYDGIRPIALYNTSSIVDQVDDFFIVQSQYYALINGYICALSYSSSNVISGVEQIVNVQGMKFIGAFPSCAYFYSPSARAIFAFTGDADLQLFVQTDRITEVYNSKYYPNCEWIFMDTNDGLYVMTQNNTFRMDAMRVKRFFPTDDEYCVLVLDNEAKDNIFLSMNKYSGWSTMPVVLETSFFGDGDMKKSTITDWYIRVFKGDEDYNGTVKCSAKTLTDIVSQVVKTFDGTKEEKLTKDKFDANDNAMITFHTGCNALGTSCRVVSDYPICYFGFSIGSDGSTNKAKLNI